MGERIWNKVDLDQIEQYITFNTDKRPRANIEYLLRFWEREKLKGHLGEMFGNELILSKKININISEKALKSKWTAFLEEGERQNSSLYYGFRTIVMDLVRLIDDSNKTLTNVKKVYKDDSISDSDPKTILSDFFYDIFHRESGIAIFMNSVAKSFQYNIKEISFSYKGETFSFLFNGTVKTLRFLTKFCKLVGGDDLIDYCKRFCDMVSIFIQGNCNNNVEETLYLSIHPLDFMTMSNNGCNWSSCMRWGQEACDAQGDYYAGSVEMMNSPIVVIAYLENKTKWYPCETGFTWSNKKWRELFIVNPNIILGIKGYPYSYDSVEIECLNWLRELAQEKLGWEYESNRRTFENEVDGFEFYTEYMYNDIRDFHLGYQSIHAAEDIAEAGPFVINYSGPMNCMCCGSIHYCDEHSVFCDDCSCRECANCCDHLSKDEWVEINGEFYCYECAHDLFHGHYCKSCNTYMQSEDDIYTVYLSKDSVENIINIFSKYEKPDWDELEKGRKYADVRCKLTSYSYQLCEYCIDFSGTGIDRTSQEIDIFAIDKYSEIGRDLRYSICTLFNNFNEKSPLSQTFDIFAEL